jgi:hypothetical protein
MAQNPWRKPREGAPTAPQRDQASHGSALFSWLGHSSILLINGDLLWTSRSRLGRELSLFFNPSAVYFPWSQISVLSKKEPEKQ